MMCALRVMHEVAASVALPPGKADVGEGSRSCDQQAAWRGLRLRGAFGGARDRRAVAAMISLLLLGLLLGMRHALEADHLAAVASLATRSKGIAGTILQGAVWGLGHTL